MAFNVYDNPTSVTIGSTSLTGVVSATTNVQYAEIHASADADIHESVARPGTARTSGTLTFVDPASADSAVGLTGTLAFTWVDVKGATNKSVSIATASITGVSTNVSRDAASNATVNWISEALPAVT